MPDEDPEPVAVEVALPELVPQPLPESDGDALAQSEPLRDGDTETLLETVGVMLPEPEPLALAESGEVPLTQLEPERDVDVVADPLAVAVPVASESSKMLLCLTKS